MNMLAPVIMILSVQAARAGWDHDKGWMITCLVLVFVAICAGLVLGENKR
jgi:hypothetical protein